MTRRSKEAPSLDFGFQAIARSVGLVEGSLVFDQQLGVITAFSGTNFHGDFHGKTPLMSEFLEDILETRSIVEISLYVKQTAISHHCLGKLT